ncbi:DMT family transporter [Shimia abyssi]|uniref:EamA-like transporter family protein n=1 Tax=Shimia abyssi TaxID=1662395 RepID=A0A2P8FEY0_9RHOB|nr:DMT family transporter [Shimia abyssi]PSL20228.1 EamA-like transporter family protein [Shimia abyssi]
MRLFLLSALTMTAFAANSVLNRAAVGELGMDPVVFGTMRLAAGAAVLGILVAMQGRGFALGGLGRAVGVAGLLIYIFGFSGAYLALDAGLGALILFGVVQVTMFGGAVIAREEVPAHRWIGAALGLSGLVWLLWPGGTVDVSFWHAVMMVGAGIGWGVYSLQGRKERDATQATAMNFLCAVPIAAVLAVGLAGPGAVSAGAVALAVVSGGITSGLGYALWYQLMPQLGASRAAVAQLSVPVIALAGGMATLGEPLTLRFVGAAVLVIAGVLVSMRR